MAIEAAVVGQFITYVGLVLSGAYNVWQSLKLKRASNTAQVAESNAQTAVADSQQTIYKLLTDRLTSLEAEQSKIREELAEERRHSRKLELHIFQLEGLMRKAGLEPPVFDTATI